MGHLLGYARVSTFDQNPDLQRDALKAAGCFRVFTDKASGTLDNRKELAKVLDQLRPGDTLAVWRLDRLGRSLRHLIETVTALAERKIGFRSLTENIDTTTAGGKLVFHLFGSLAEFERDLIRDRTMAGLTAARVGGRPPALTPDKLAVARQMHASRQHLNGSHRQSRWRQPSNPLPPPRPTTTSAASEDRPTTGLLVILPGCRHSSVSL